MMDDCKLVTCTECGCLTMEQRKKKAPSKTDLLNQGLGFRSGIDTELDAPKKEK